MDKKEVTPIDNREVRIGLPRKKRTNESVYVTKFPV